MDKNKQFQEVFDTLYPLAIQKKIRFLEVFLFYCTIAARGIWSDDTRSDAEKLEALKWLNELSHRIWNLLFELQQGEDDDNTRRLYENLKFYGDQSLLLRSHLWPTILNSFERFKNKINNQ